VPESSPFDLSTFSGSLHSDLMSPTIAQQLAAYTGADTVLVGRTTERGELVTLAVKFVDIARDATVAAGDIALRKGRTSLRCREEEIQAGRGKSAEASKPAGL